MDIKEPEKNILFPIEKHNKSVSSSVCLSGTIYHIITSSRLYLCIKV